jgi:hypothetical protein
VIPGLLKINALAGTVESDLTIFAATLGANPAVNRRAEALLLTSFADGTAQRDLAQHYGTLGCGGDENELMIPDRIRAREARRVSFGVEYLSGSN